MSTTLPALYTTVFPVEFLRDIALLNAPKEVAEAYGYDFDRIKDLPNFKAQLAKVEAELFNDGTLTRAMAEVGLNKAIETISLRIAGGAISNDDLNKFTNTLHKVSNRDGEKGGGSSKPQFTIEINLGPDTVTLTANAQSPNRVIDVTESEEDLEQETTDATSTAGSVAILDEFEADDLSTLPNDLLDTIANTNDFGLDID